MLLQPERSEDHFPVRSAAPVAPVAAVASRTHEPEPLQDLD
ncbi:hypothetical protein ARZXY2_4854 (plasmid) [Arthrobacter sp. ZXY-2]|nr:hypothetical protein ARZXY2_4854 [Arthrobacter sp. ZXY-2]